MVVVVVAVVNLPDLDVARLELDADSRELDRKALIGFWPEPETGPPTLGLVRHGLLFTALFKLDCNCSHDPLLGVTLLTLTAAAAADDLPLSPLLQLLPPPRLAPLWLVLPGRLPPWPLRKDSFS